MLQPFRDYAKFNGYLPRRSSFLSSSFSVSQQLFTTDHILFLVKEFSASISNISEIVELQKSHSLTPYVESQVALRRQADRDGNGAIAAYAKLSLNSCYGMSLLR